MTRYIKKSVLRGFCEMAEQEAPGSGLSTPTAIATAEMLKGGLWGEMKGHQTVI